ncbi:hypothetical protein [Yersinia rochesterensis]|nr:hypothetical protein [Yersinia rochesterensis]
MSRLRETYHESNGSAGARNIASMVTTKGRCRQVFATFWVLFT